jgi:hypothetical protein
MTLVAGAAWSSALRATTTVVAAARAALIALRSRAARISMLDTGPLPVVERTRCAARSVLKLSSSSAGIAHSS